MPAEHLLISWPDSAEDALPTCSAPLIPQGPCPVCPRLAQEFEPWRQAAYYKAMLDRAVAREALLKEEVASLQARLRLREQQLFGRKAGSTTSAEVSARPARARHPRGQQPGKPGPKRRDYSHLPAVEQVLELPPERQRCSGCGQPLAPFPGTDDTTVLEIEVRAHRRIYRRRRYVPPAPVGTTPASSPRPSPAS
jgi:transposase